MKKNQFLILVTLMGAVFVLQSCARTSNDVWEDTKSAGRHMQRGVRALGGKHGASRQVYSRSDFECIEDEGYFPDGGFQDCEYQDRCVPADFIPLEGQVNNPAANGFAPSRETPGEAGSSLPSIEAFRDPSTLPQLAGIFRPIYFEYDSSLIKGQPNLQTIHAIADFLRARPHMYVFIEGHTDERGPQAYNLALGSRRSNAVRNMLIHEGIHPDRLFTISYGKERPVVLERHEEGWSKNRRAEFKVYER
jgi:peptidoglycan-associated lipoprotein